MSKGNNPIKVLKTALKRVAKSWYQGGWVKQDDKGNYGVCLEGAIYGYCQGENATQAQKDAIEAVKGVIADRYPQSYINVQGDLVMVSADQTSIPHFNDNDATTKDMVMEVIKLGIIRLEADKDEAAMEEQLTDEVDELFDGPQVREAAQA